MESNHRRLAYQTSILPLNYTCIFKLSSSWELNPDKRGCSPLPLPYGLEHIITTQSTSFPRIHHCHSVLSTVESLVNSNHRIIYRLTRSLSACGRYRACILRIFSPVLRPRKLHRQNKVTTQVSSPRNLI